MRVFHLAGSGVDQGDSPTGVGEPDVGRRPEPASKVPWGQDIELTTKLRDAPSARLRYAHHAISHGWSRAVQAHQIESRLHERLGPDVMNFRATLPDSRSDMAHSLLKDPYNFESLRLTPEAREREVGRGLLAHLRKSMLESGAGFAFVGEQRHLAVGGEDFRIDLLVYHLRPRCLVVIDLEIEPFKPESAGKTNLYLSAVDDLLRNADDRPGIGLILCRDRNALVAEYALRDLSKPIGVAGYRLTDHLPADLEESLPTVEEIEAGLSSRQDRSPVGRTTLRKPGNRPRPTLRPQTRNLRFLPHPRDLLRRRSLHDPTRGPRSDACLPTFARCDR
jgi:predicted nuclease of restriction endonuclease-like (RecB) superfamily